MIDELMTGATFSLDPRDEEVSVDFALDRACPGLGVGFAFEGLARGWIALAANVRFPPIPAATLECGKNDVQDWGRFVSEARTLVTQGKEDGALGGIRTHDPCLRRAVLYPAELRVQRGRHDTHLGVWRPSP